MEKLRNIAVRVLFSLLVAGSVCSLFLPPPRAVSPNDFGYICRFEGSVELLRFAEIYPLLDGTDGQTIYLDREGERGAVAGSEPFSRAYGLLSDGPFADLYALRTDGLNSVERAALFRAFGGTSYYAGEEFRYGGVRLERMTRANADRVVLLDGALPKGYLSDMGASELVITSSASVKAEDLAGSEVCKITAFSPYRAEGDALYYDGAEGIRLVAAFPVAKELSLLGMDFIDRGALAPCKELTSLTLAFVGASPDLRGGAWVEFSALFDEEYGVPAGLKRVKVTGGSLAAYCFLGAPAVEEIDCCGMDPANIDPGAFTGCGWRILHTPRADLALSGSYESETAPCGCTVYRRLS